MKRNLLIGANVYRITRADWCYMPSGALKEDRTIVVSNHKGSPDADETLFHEMFHACELEIGHKSPERYVEDMAVILFKTLKRNGMLSMDVEWNQLEIDYLEPPKSVV